MSIKLSVVIISFNEELKIERCLKSVMDISDDIVVVDSFSKDGTGEICKKYPVNFISQKWLGFAEQKNVGNSAAKNDWILSIDADEELSDELKESIKALDFNSNENMVYEVKILPNYCGKWIRHGGWYPAKKIRLWNKKFAQWKGDIHEELAFSPAPKQLICLGGDLLHYSYDSVSQHIDKVNKYTDILAKELYKKGRTANLLIVIPRAIWSFPRCYIFWLGFLDGYYGFVIACLAPYQTFLKFVKLIELRRKNHKKV